MKNEIRFKKKDILKLIEQGNDRELCFIMLYEVYEEGAFSNLVIKKADKAAREYGKSLDFVRAMLYGTITYTFTIDFLVRHICKEECEEMDPVARTAIRMAIWQMQFGDNIPDYAACDSAVEIVKKYNPKAAGFVNAVLRKYTKAPEAKKYIEQYKPGIRVSLKPEIYGILKNDFGKQRAYEIGKAFLEPPKVTVRFDPIKYTREEIVLSFAKDGIAAVPGKFVPSCLEISGNLKNLEKTEAFTKYGVFVQGEGAMLASIVACPKKGDKILDCCAAPGGKTTHMAEIAGRDCEITALDINESRVELINENCARLGIDCVNTICMDAAKISKDKDNRKSFDIVLCDVPCSGLGLIGKKPDIRERMTFDDMEALLPVQYDILDHACKMVRPGGALIYCTCTLNSSENEEQVQRFIEEHKNFHTVSILDHLPNNIYMDNDRREEASNGMITLCPDTDGCEGFFICRIERDGNE
ncbi:MAG: 16S rRNA (cytosine(967)-C(5))-methyltransferase RsmB [Saccharofermentans sp.]|nr:16S rRNA (cytosine(967)-C(5))-methyltransferase RsmB [Saccharofermentans sp.]